MGNNNQGKNYKNFLHGNIGLYQTVNNFNQNSISFEIVFYFQEFLN